MAGSYAHAPWCVENGQGGHEMPVIRQRLAHAHKDKIIHPLAGDGFGLEDLFDNFRWLQVARQPVQAAGAELALHGATDLGGDAEGVAVGSFSIQSGVGWDDDGLDEPAIGQLEEEFPSRVARSLRAHCLQRTQGE